MTLIERLAEWKIFCFAYRKNFDKLRCQAKVLIRVETKGAASVVKRGGIEGAFKKVVVKSFEINADEETFGLKEGDCGGACSILAPGRELLSHWLWLEEEIGFPKDGANM